MQREASVPASSSMSLLAIVGGVAAVVGVFLSWGEVTGASIGGQILGQEIPAESLGAAELDDLKRVADLSFSGLSSTAGVFLLIGGIIAAVGGLVRMIGVDDARRRLGSWVAAGGGVLAVAMAVVGFLTRGSAGSDAFFSAIEDAAKADPEAAAALGGAGVDMSAALDLIKDFITVETSIGVGLIVAAVGSLAAVLAGLALVASSRAPAAIPTAGGWSGAGGGFVPGAAPEAPPAAPMPPPAQPPASPEPPPGPRPEEGGPGEPSP